MGLDVGTLYYSSAVSRTAYLVVFIVIALRQRDQTYLFDWIFALVCSVAATAFVAMDPNQGRISTVTMFLVHTIFLCSLSFSWSGLRRFHGRAVSVPTTILVAAVPSVLPMLTENLGISARFSMIWVVLGATGLAGAVVYEAWVNRREGLWSQYVVGTAFLFYTLALAATLGVLLLTNRTVSLFESGRVAMLVDQFAGICVYFGYIAMAAERAQLTLRQLADTDWLTGLANRRGLDTLLAQGRRKGASRSGSVLLCDIDKFKWINDDHGHEAGDSVLTNFAAILRQSLRQSDIAVRWGGEEFLVVLPGSDPANAAEVAERLRRNVESTPFETGVSTLSVTVSIGVAAYEASQSVHQATERADDALYEAKEGGRNRVCRHDAGRRDAGEAIPAKTAEEPVFEPPLSSGPLPTR